MADNNAATGSEPERMNLKLLSLAPEFQHRELDFPGVPAKMTVGELKIKLRDELPTHPAVARMRLIHAGRVLARDSDTILDVFGRETVQQYPHETYKLHLVLRELHHSTSTTPLSSGSSQSARSSTVPPAPQNPFRPAVAPGATAPTSSADTNPFRAQTGRTTSQPQTPLQQHAQVHQHLPPHIHQGPFPTPFPHQPSTFPQLPPEINTILNQQFAHLPPHMRPPPNPPQNPTPAAQNGTSAEQPSSPNGETRPQSAFQQFVARQQQQRAATGMAGGGDNQNGTTDDTGQSNEQDQSNTPGSTSVPGSGQPGNPFSQGQNSSFTREMVGPNGQRWTVTVNNNTMTIPPRPPGPFPPPHMHAHPQFPGFPPGFPMNMARGPSPGANPGGVGVTGATVGAVNAQATSVNEAAVRASLDQVERELATLRSQLSSSNEGVVDGPSHLRNHVQNLVRNLDQMQHAINSLVLNPAFAQDRNAVTLQMQNRALRLAAGRLIDTINHTNAGNPPAEQSTESQASATATATVTSAIPGTMTTGDAASSSTADPLTATVGNSLLSASRTGLGSLTTALGATVHPQGSEDPKIYILQTPEGRRFLLCPLEDNRPSSTVPAQTAQESQEGQGNQTDHGAQPSEGSQGDQQGLPNQAGVTVELHGDPDRGILEALDNLHARNAQAMQANLARIEELRQTLAQRDNRRMAALQSAQYRATTNPLTNPGDGIAGPVGTDAANENGNPQHDVNNPPGQGLPNPPGVQPGQPAEARPQPANQLAPLLQNGAARAAAQNDPAVLVARHLWTALRIFGLLFFLWRMGLTLNRGFFIAVLFGLFFLGQNGFLDGRFGMVRRYLEGLLGLPIPQEERERREREAGQRQGQGQGGEAQANADGQAQGGRRREPNPQEAAARLLRERENQNMGRLRDVARLFERLVALFVASLYPGVGEDMVRRREQADVDARRAQAEAEAEATRREEEERKKREDAEKGGEAGESANANENAGEKAEDDEEEETRALFSYVPGLTERTNGQEASSSSSSQEETTSKGKGKARAVTADDIQEESPAGSTSGEGRHTPASSAGAEGVTTTEVQAEDMNVPNWGSLD